jgi:hypothetical protein
MNAFDRRVGLARGGSRSERMTAPLVHMRLLQIDIASDKGISFEYLTHV